MKIRRSRWFLLLVMLGLLICTAIVLTRNLNPSRSPGVVFVFLALTNDPGPSSYPQISVLSDGRGLHALFRATNAGAGYIKFGVSSTQHQVQDNWETLETASLKMELGSMWKPGFGCTYAIPWPAGLETNAAWRLQLWEMREPNPVMMWINQRLGRKVFHPYGRHSLPGPVVTPPPA